MTEMPTCSPFVVSLLRLAKEVKIGSERNLDHRKALSIIKADMEDGKW